MRRHWMFDQSRPDVSPDWTGMTPLHYAAENGCVELVQWCLMHGVHPNIRDSYGRTPLHWASTHKSSSRRRSRNNSRSATCLEIRQSLEIRRHQLGHQLAWDPILRVPIYDEAEVIRRLLHGKADIRAKDSNGNMPFDIANETSCSDINTPTCQLLLQKLASTPVVPCRLLMVRLTARDIGLPSLEAKKWVAADNPITFQMCRIGTRVPFSEAGSPGGWAERVWRRAHGYHVPVVRSLGAEMFRRSCGSPPQTLLPMAKQNTW